MVPPNLPSSCGTGALLVACSSLPARLLLSAWCVLTDSGVTRCR